MSERDIVQRVVAKGLSVESTLVKDVMTRKVVCVDLTEGLGKVHKKMREIKFRHLPVVKDDRVVGMVSNRDLMYLRKLKLETR